LSDLSAEDALAALHDRIRACRLCRYGHAPSPVVQGSAASRIMVIGQAPGKTEEGSGLPWMGPAGKRLMKWMTDEVGFTSPDDFRRQVYLAAVTRCFPGSHPSGKGDLKPSPFEIKNCEPFLREELTLVKPAVILLVGGLAIERFLGKGIKLDQAIGRVFTMAFEGLEARLIPLPHPSGASTWLNQPAHQELLKQGLEELRNIIVAEGLAALK
jgi:uracil-DNA glycosylase